MASQLNQEQCTTLLKLARESIARKLDVSEGFDLTEQQRASFADDRATFVTLKKDGQLRGCIGSLIPFESLEKSVASNAVKAALNDSRFSPLSPLELKDTQIEVSVLSPTRTLEYSDYQDLVNLLRPGVDGVILRFGGRSATFLPQVWEQLPRTEQFLGHLCRKAGLPETIWKTEKVEIEIYQVQHFQEEEV